MNREELLDILTRCSEYFDQRADVDVSGDPLTEDPNEEMLIGQDVDRAIRYLREEHASA